MLRSMLSRAAVVLSGLSLTAALLAVPVPASDPPSCCASPVAKCTGSRSCRVCTNCSRCAHCKGAGSCGVCSAADR